MPSQSQGAFQYWSSGKPLEALTEVGVGEDYETLEDLISANTAAGGLLLYNNKIVTEKSTGDRYIYNNNLGTFTIHRGAIWHYGESDPISDIGIINDYYLNTITGDFFQKIDGIWGTAIANLKGADGIDGTPGEEIDLQVTATHIQWRLGGGAWNDLVALSELQGADGTDGSPGADGVSAYVYVRYASDNTGTGFTANPSGMEYMAVLSTDTEITSPVVGDFNGLWVKIKGEQGIQGEQGPQGVPGENASLTDSQATALVELLESISIDENGNVIIGSEISPKTLKVFGSANTYEKEVSLINKTAVGLGETDTINLAQFDKYRFINVNQNLTVKNVSNPENGMMFVLIFVASASVTISFSVEWGDLEAVDLASGDVLMVSGYISGGSIIASHNKPTGTVAIDAPLIDTFYLDANGLTTTDRVVDLDLTVTGAYTQYKIVEGTQESDLNSVGWQTGVVPATFELSAGNEEKTVFIQLRNAGGDSNIGSDSISLEIPVPVISSFTAGGGDTTTTRVISLDITATNSPTHYRVTHVADGATQPDMSGLSWLPITGSDTYELPDVQGDYDVWVQVRNDGMVASNAVKDDIEYSIPVNQPTANAGDDATICELGTHQLAGQATNQDSVLWSTSGDGTFDDATSLNAVYTPGTNDKSTGLATLTLTVSASGFDDVTDDLTLTIQAAPSVDAGGNQSIYEGQTVQLAGATAANYSSLSWSTSGTGTFDNNTILNPTYTPSAADIAGGGVTLTLTVNAISPCSGIETDVKTITIQAIVVPSFTFTAVDNGSGAATLTITPNVEGSASHMKILDVANGAEEPDEAAWSAATQIAFESPHTYTPIATGNRDIYVRLIHDASGGNSTQSDNVTIAAGSASPIEVYKLAFGRNSSVRISGFRGISQNGSSYGEFTIEGSVNPSNLLTMNQPDPATFPTGSDWKKGSLNRRVVGFDNPDFPDADDATSVVIYPHWVNSPQMICRWRFSNLNIDNTYKFRIMSNTASTATDQNWSYFELSGLTNVNGGIDPRGNQGEEVVLEVKPDSNGEIIMAVSNQDFAPNEDAFLNAMIIEEYA